MDDLAEIRNEEIHLRDAGLLQSATVLAACSMAGRSLSARPVAPVSLASPPVVPSIARGESVGIHYDHCGRDRHMEAFCYRKEKGQKAQAYRSSQGTGGTGSVGSERSFTSSDTQETLMLLHCLAASTSSWAVGSVTQPSAPTGSTTASQSSALGPPSSPSPSTDFGASFHMTPHFAHLFALHPSCHHCTIHTVDGFPLSVVGQGMFYSDSFHVPDVSLVPDLTMQLMFAGQITDHDYHVILDPNFAIFRIVTWVI
jgi:hypothetical protein